MRVRVCVLALLVGCSFDRGGVGDDVEVPPDAFVDPGDDGGGIPRTWTDDTVDDFAAAGAVLDDAIVEPWGAIGPAAYATGGLLVRTADTELFDDTNDDWADVAAVTPAGTAMWANLERDGRPAGVGITHDDTFTVWLEGEVWLDAGAHTFFLAADDRGYLDIASPRTSEFTRVVRATYDQDGTGDYTAASAGWHPIRIAWAQGIVLATLEVQLRVPGAEASAPIPADRLRFRADVPGLVWTAYDDSKLLEPVETFLYQAPAFDFRPSNGAITSLGLSESDRFSMRWAGQFRVEVAGDYVFQLSTDDGQRLWIDGAPVLDHWTDDSQYHLTDPVALDVGWHDLVVDLTDNTGGQQLRFWVVSGPELVEEELPADRLRPSRPRHERALGGVDDTDAALPDGADEVTYAFRFPDSEGAVATGIEVAVTGNHQRWADVEIAVIPPGGDAIVALAVDGADVTGSQTIRRTAAVPGGQAASGVWTVRIRDTLAADIGTIGKVALTARYTGGAPPIAPVAVYESPVEDLGAVVGFDAVTWDGRLPDGASVAVALRSCDTADACAAEPWSTPVTTSGGAPPVLARRFVQYRLELGSDGDVTPYVDRVTIAYRASE